MAENTTAQPPQMAAMMPSTSPQMEKPFILSSPLSKKKRSFSAIIAHFPREVKPWGGVFSRQCGGNVVVGKFADKNKIFMKNS